VSALEDAVSAALDADALMRALDAVAGRRLLGVVPSYDCIELVFTDGEPRGNLVSIYVRGRMAGRVAFGGVDDPVGYAQRNHAARWASA
jgi:hypothetical protein